nr:MAG TPA_asm: hypothetical protein [Bacteriophage sp.]
MISRIRPIIRVFGLTLSGGGCSPHFFLCLD